MPKHNRPTKIKVVPKDGEIEITLNININVDGISVSTEDAEELCEEQSEEKVLYALPEFGPTKKINFGKKE